MLGLLIRLLVALPLLLGAVALATIAALEFFVAGIWHGPLWVIALVALLGAAGTHQVARSTYPI